MRIKTSPIIGVTVKQLLFLSLLLFSFSAFSCPNFSGEYLDEMDGTYFAIEQKDCATIDYIYDEGVVTAIIDGEDHLVNQYEIVVEEGKVLATVEIYQTHSFNKKTLITHGRSETVYASGESEIHKETSETYLDKNKNMISVTKDENGDKEKTIFTRVN